MRRITAWICAGLAAWMAGCTTLPSLEGRSVSYAATDTSTGRIGREIAPRVAANPGKSGVYDLSLARDAFAARILLATLADKSLDVQYYIWHPDQAGELLFEALWNAGQRGVRVRLLLDDNNTRDLDPTIAALDANPNIEVRLYNPFVTRGARVLDFMTDFARVNRRMHNKSFTADNQLSIVGGRNIGNEYFAVGHGVVFADWDVLVAGAAVQDIEQAFDRYWNSASAYPAVGLVGSSPADAATMLEARFAAVRRDPESAAYLDTVRTTPLLGDLKDNRLPFEWTTARLVVDDPEKTLDTTDRTDILLFPKLIRSFGRAERSFDLVSPYFVPGDDGTEAIAEMSRRGLKVRIVTNSLAASDAKSVHAGYAKHRQQLLQAGVQIFELKPTLAGGSAGTTPRIGSSSSAALHAKAYAVDRRRIFIGSFNFDQRSTFLNTEMGLVIDSPKLANDLASDLDSKVVLVAYEVRLAPDGRLQWVERTASGESIYDVEPGTSWWQRTTIDFLSILPIDWLL
jgi:putative cardiolipin synthase